MEFSDKMADPEKYLPPPPLPKQVGPFVFEGEPTEVEEEEAAAAMTLASSEKGAALWLEEQRALRYRQALEGAEELIGWLDGFYPNMGRENGLNVFDLLTSERHPDEINRRIDAVEAALADAPVETVLVELSKEELQLLDEGLDSYTYWEIGDTHCRNDGYFREDLCDPEDEEDAERLERYAEVEALQAKLEAAQAGQAASPDHATPEVVAFLESLLSSEPLEAVDLLTNDGQDVLDRWHEARRATT